MSYEVNSGGYQLGVLAASLQQSYDNFHLEKLNRIYENTAQNNRDLATISAALSHLENKMHDGEYNLRAHRELFIQAQAIYNRMREDTVLFTETMDLPAELEDLSAEEMRTLMNQISDSKLIMQGDNQQLLLEMNKQGQLLLVIVEATRKMVKDVTEGAQTAIRHMSQGT